MQDRSARSPAAALSDQQAGRTRGSGSRPQQDGARATPRRGSSDRCRQEAPPRTAVGVAHVQRPKPVLRARTVRCVARTGAQFGSRPDLRMTSRVPSRVQTAGNDAGGPHSSACLLRLTTPLTAACIGGCPRCRWSGIRRIVSRAIPARASGTCRYAVLAQPISPPASSHWSVVRSLGGCVETGVGVAVLCRERAPGTLVGERSTLEGDPGRSATRTARCRGSHRNSRTAAPNRRLLHTSARTRRGTSPVRRTPRLGPSPRHRARSLPGVR